MPLHHENLGTFPAPGDTVGSYQIEVPLGSGAMATVFRAAAPGQPPIALKILHPGQVFPEDIKRFTREYQMLSDLDHPHIVRVYETGVYEGYPWIAMEYVEGSDLEVLAEQWQVDPPHDRHFRIEKLIRGLCSGLGYLHELGYVHRDIKPSNLLVNREGQAKLTDFGVVKGTNTYNTQLTMAGRLVGTVAFMAPELITGDPVDARTDLYALGTVLYVLLTHRKPIEADSVAGYLARHLSETPRPPHELDPTTPSHLETVCLKLLRKDANERFSSASAVLKALDAKPGQSTMPLRGREDALEQFRDRIRRLQHGEGGFLELIGAPSSGRSTLLGAMADLAKESGVTLKAADVAQEALPNVQLDDNSSPQVVALDNLNALSPDRNKVLKRTVRRTIGLEGKPVLWVCVRGGTEAPQGSWDDIEEAGVTPESIPLTPLSLEAVIALLRDRGFSAPASKVLGRRLHGLFEGSPGRALEQVDALFEAGWLKRQPEKIEVTCALTDLRDKELPLSSSAVAVASHTLDQLDPPTHALVVLLALLGRPASTSTLAQCRPHPETVAPLLERMVNARLLCQDDQTPPRYRLTEESLGRIARQRLDPNAKQAIHRTLADVLSARRRRAIGVEVARHRELAGQPGEAYLAYVSSCLRAERARQVHDVLRWTRQAQAVEAQALKVLDPSQAHPAVRMLAKLRGHALLRTDQTEEACEQLGRSLHPRWGQPSEEEGARTRALLGEGLARTGEATAAIDQLKEALLVLPKGAPERPSALGRLTQLRLLKGDLHAAIETIEPAVERARERNLGGRAEASLNRRLASARAVEGRLVDARILLEASDLALRRSPNEHLEERAILLCDLGDLDLVAGRYARAIHHAEQALELCSEVREVNRVCAAYAILAVAHWRIGQGPKAAEAAERMGLYLRGEGVAVWRPRLHTARVWLGLGEPDRAQKLLSTHQPPPDDQSFGTRAWWRALGARCVAESDPDQAASAAQRALQNLPLGRVSALDLLLDLSEAFLAIGQPDRCVPALSQYLPLTETADAAGLQLEANLIAHRLEGASVDISSCRSWIEEIRRHLHGPTAPAFLRRPDIIDLLERNPLEG